MLMFYNFISFVQGFYSVFKKVMLRLVDDVDVDVVDEVTSTTIYRQGVL